MELTVIDYVLLAVVGISALIGLFRGFVREALSLVTWIVAIWCAWRLAGIVAGWLPDFVADATVKLWLTRLGILVAVLIAGGILSWLVGRLMHMTGLTGTDRTVGLVFGVARGMVVAGLLVLVLEFAGFGESPWWQESRLIPLTTPLSERMREAAGSGLAAIDSGETN